MGGVVGGCSRDDGASMGNEPTTSYAICAVQRSGSFLLCEALKLRVQETALSEVPRWGQAMDTQALGTD